MQNNYHNVPLRLKPLYYLLVLFGLFFFSQTNFDTHTKHNYVALHESHVVLKTNKIDFKLPKETVDLKHRSEHKRNHIVQRKRGTVAFFIKKNLHAWTNLAKYNNAWVTHNYNRCTHIFIRPLYYVYLFRYALF